SRRRRRPALRPRVDGDSPGAAASAMVPDWIAAVRNGARIRADRVATSSARTRLVLGPAEGGPLHTIRASIRAHADIQGPRDTSHATALHRLYRVDHHTRPRHGAGESRYLRRSDRGRGRDGALRVGGGLTR